MQFNCGMQFIYNVYDGHILQKSLIRLGSFFIKHHANTYSQTHENIIINSQSFAKVCSIVTKSSSNVDGPSYIHGQFTSLEKCVFKLAQYYISRLVLGQAKLKCVFGSPA